MRLILPTESEISLLPGAADGLGGDLLYTIAGEPRPTPPGRPWVLANMVSTADGAAAGMEGHSASLSGPADRQLFAVLRSLADVILAGAGTVRAENYGAPRLAPGADALRRSHGQAPLPRLAVVSGTLRLDPAARLFHEATPAARPIILTSAHAATNARDQLAALANVADVHQVGTASVDWAAALRLLHDSYNAGTVLVEGGPTVNAQLVELDLVDELCLTIAPLLLGGSARRILADVPAVTPRSLVLDRAFEDQGFLLLRYLRKR